MAKTKMMRIVALALCIGVAACTAGPVDETEKKIAVIDDQAVTKQNAAKYFSDLLRQFLGPSGDPDVLLNALGATGIETQRWSDGPVMMYQFLLDPRYVEVARSNISSQRVDGRPQLDGVWIQIKPGVKLHPDDMVPYLGVYLAAPPGVHRLGYEVFYDELVIPNTRVRGGVSMALSDTPENPEAVVDSIDITRRDRPHFGDAGK